MPNSLQAYLDKYPTGEFVALAEIRLKELAERPPARRPSRLLHRRRRRLPRTAAWP